MTAVYPLAVATFDEESWRESVAAGARNPGNWLYSAIQLKRASNILRKAWQEESRAMPALLAEVQGRECASLWPSDFEGPHPLLVVVTRDRQAAGHGFEPSTAMTRKPDSPWSSTTTTCNQTPGAPAGREAARPVTDRAHSVITPR